MKLHIGFDENDYPLYLTEEDFETHFHGIGATRTGKSKFIEHIIRQLIRRGDGFMLIDPHGSLYEDVLTWLAYLQPCYQDILLLNPSYTRRIVGFNPFRPTGEDFGTQADAIVEAIIKAWGAADTDETPTLERVLTCIVHTLIEGKYSIELAPYLLYQKHAKIRDQLIRSVETEIIRTEWDELGRLSRGDHETEFKSTRNRLFRFLRHKQFRRMFGLLNNTIDIGDIVENGKILLVNLQEADYVSAKSARVTGTLLLNDLWQFARKRPKNASPFFVFVDEIEKFLTPDIPAMLEEVGKRGIHLFLFHQHLHQLRRVDPTIASSVMTNARVKFIFGGLERQDAMEMVDNCFPKQIDLKRIKFLIESTKFWPQYERETVYSRAAGHVTGRGTAWDEAQSRVLIETTRVALPEAALGPEYVPFTAGESLVRAERSGTSRYDADSFSDGYADVPFYRLIPFKEISGVIPYSLEELRWMLADELMEQYQRHYFIHRPGKQTVAAVTPFVKPWHVTPECKDAYVEALLARFFTADRVDRELEAIHKNLIKPAPDEHEDFDPEKLWETPVDTDDMEQVE